MGVSGTVLITGATPAVNGTSGRVFYQNSASLGQMTTTGSGTQLVLDTSPTITTSLVINEGAGSSGLTITGATQTSSFPVLSMTQTWNNSGTTFTGMLINVTSTASASGSLLADFKVGNASQANISKGGNILATVQTGGAANNVSLGISSSRGIWSSGSTLLDLAANNNGMLALDGSTLTALVPANVALGFGGGNAGSISVGNTISAAFYRDAAAAIGQRNSTTAQVFRVYNTFSSSTSYERLELDWTTTSNVMLIGCQKGSGGGTARVMNLVYGGTSTAAISVPITSGTVTFGGSLTVPGGATFLITNTALTDGAAGSTGTLTNAPAVGNPTKWIGINDNGTTRYIPAW